MTQTEKDIKFLNKAIFEQLFKDYFKALTAFAKKHVGDMDTAKEIVHEVFLNLWTKKDTIEIEKAVKAYLYTSVYNRSINHIRDHKKFNKNIDIETDLNKISSWDFSENIDAIELEEKINKTIESLPEKCRNIFIMSRFDGLKYNEIAEKLKISVKTVETQMSKALKVLRTELKEYLTILILMILCN